MIPRFGDRRDWFFQRRYGMFIHWGLYAIPAWHEQIQWRRRIARAQYEPLIGQFNPRRFNPDEWLDLSQEAGMEYLCVTTKHHDGFCLWDTAQTEFKVTRSPYGRDILRQVADACGRRGVPLCLYYSVVDWHHPNYPNQDRSHELAGPEPGDRPDLGRYLAFLREQVRELCSNYGELAGFWWDMNVTGLRDTSVNALIRDLQPGAVINNRGFDDGDFGTPEREFPQHAGEVGAAGDFARPTEACQSVGAQSWGFREGEDYFTDRHLQAAIDRVRCKDGNYLLNVGPQADGTIPGEAAATLRRVGQWVRAVGEAWDGVEWAGDLTNNRDVLLTRRGATLYVHLNAAPRASGVSLRPLAVAPRRATLLNTGAPVETRVDVLPNDFRAGAPSLRLVGLPANELANSVMIVRLDFNEPPQRPL